MTYSVNQIMERYSVSQQTVLGWINRGELKAINVGRALGKQKPRWRVTDKALTAFENLRSARPSQPRGRRRRSKSSSHVIEFYK